MDFGGVMNKPVIGIPASKFPAGKWNLIQHALSEHYVRSVEEAGGLAMIIPHGTDEELLQGYVDACDGILVPGGIDVDPVLFHEERHELCGESDMAYDLFQISIIQKTVSAGKPLFGICRGLQIINVAFGGTLYQDLSLACEKPLKHVQDEYRNVATHKVRIADDSMLQMLLGEELEVNSFHHQVIHELGSGLKAVAWAEDGLIEGIESDVFPNLLAVQWHPENFIMNREDEMLPFFVKLVALSSKG